MAIQTFYSTHNNPGIELPVCSVLVSEHGRGILFPPVKFSDEQILKIHVSGGVTDLVAPCLFHHVAMPQAIKLFPNARIWHVPGLEKKRPDIPWTNELTPESWPYKNVLDILKIEGAPEINEVEFLHKSSRTLIATDICFNMQKPKGFMAGIVLRAMGTYNGFAMSRLFKSFIKDKAAFEKSANQLLSWDFDRIIMSHGTPVETGGKELLRSAISQRGFFSSQNETQSL